jgi:hypothetical protein
MKATTMTVKVTAHFRAAEIWGASDTGISRVDRRAVPRPGTRRVA